MGSGGGGNQSVTQEFKPPENTKEGWQGYIDNLTKLKEVPYQQSGLPTVAPLNDYQHSANQLAYDRAFYGAPDINAARGAAMNAAQGNYSNPWAQNVGGIASGAAFNPAMEGYAEMSKGGTNPFTEQMIGDNAQNMAQSYAAGDAANMNASAARSGAFGGSAHDQRAQAGAAGLAKQVGQMATGARQSQHQADIGNRFQALGGYANTYQGDVGNQLNANAQGGGMWQGDIANILQGAGLGGQLSQDDYTSMRVLMDAGNNFNTYNQKLLDAANNQYNTESSYDQMMNEIFGTGLSRASGSYGGQATTGPGQSPWAGIAGLLGTGAGMYSLYK